MTRLRLAGLHLAGLVLLPLAACSASGPGTLLVGPPEPVPSAYAEDEVDVGAEPLDGIGGLQRRVEYPVDARRGGISGIVTVLAVVDTSGAVVWSSVEAPVHPLLDEAARRAVHASAFRAALKDDEPVAAWISIPIGFHLRPGRPAPYDPDQ